MRERLPEITKSPGHQIGKGNARGTRPFWTFWDFIWKRMGGRIELYLLDAVAANAYKIYRFDLLRVKFAPLSKQIGALHLMGDRWF